MKIAFVIQRYGENISGGAEYYCRCVAEHLSKYHEVEIVTTCATEYSTWKNEYEPGIHYTNGILTRRFENDFERSEQFHKLYLKILGGITPNNFKENYNYMISNIKKTSISEQIECIRLQGPFSSDLLDYLDVNSHIYDAFIFFTYMYPTTVFGMRKVPPSKILLVPTAHDEPLIYFEIFKDIFNIPQAIIYNTKEEKDFIVSKFGNEHITNEIIGMGVDVPKSLISENFRKKNEIFNDYIVYVGRVDQIKGCEDLFEYFIRYKKEHEYTQIKLVLIGKSEMKIPIHLDIIHVGFVSEKDKFDGIKGSKLLVMPSEFESLSLVTLEAWQLNVPVLVNENCKVLKGHCLKSNGGLYYSNYAEFEVCLDLMLENNELCARMGENGRRYVEENYGWDVVESKYLRLLDELKDT